MADEDSEDEFDKNLKSNKKKKEGDRKGFYRKGKGLVKGRSGRGKKLSISLLSGNGTTVAHSSFGLDVPLYASEGRVLELAAQKLIAMRKVDEESAGHLLLCEGDGSWLKYVPGTKQLFVVKDYLEFRNLPSSKIHLYVMTRENYIVLQKSKERQDRDKHWKEARLLLDDSSEDPNEDWWRARVPVTDHDYEFAMELQQFYDNEEAKFAPDEDDADQNASREQTEEPSVVLVATSMTKEEKRKLRDLVHDLNHKNIQDPENSKLYTIRRDKAWENFVDNISLKTFNACRPIEIKFIGEEETVDTGGPRNEMFRLAFIDIFETSGLFEPSQIGFLPISSAMSVADEEFLKVGKMMALSIVHLGPTPAFLHPAVVAGICGRKLPATAMSPFQPVDGETAAFVNKLESATQETVVSLFASDVGLVMRSKVGWKKPAGKATMGDAALLRNLLCLEDLVLSRKSAIDQLRQGLKLFDLLHVLEREPQLSGALLQKSMKPVSADDIKRTLDVHWAAEGSNKKERQKDLYERLTKWLDSVEEG
ncbi:G2E3 [Branchiostoma lanceolatum]|nr:G2E3 [Branchiostoma lanceolatum]